MTGKPYALTFIHCLLGITLALLISTGYAAAFDYFQPLPEQPLTPEQNPLTDEKIALGKKLFFDKRLSSNNQLSCNDCHNLSNSGNPAPALAMGVSGKTSKRNPPTLLNIGLQTVLYWDGRTASLEQQAIDHLGDPDIMGNTEKEALLNKLSKDKHYVKEFMNAFDSAHAIKMQNIANALASFQRALMTPNSPFDRYIKGDDKAISAQAKIGMQLFNDTGCLACHFGVNFAGPAPGPAMGMGDGFYELFPNNVGSVYDKSHRLTDDLGRYEFSKDPGEKYMWRVPPLRNIALTAPYFHNGSAKTLHEAVTIMAKTQTNKTLTKTEIDAIVVFLQTLTGELPAVLKN
ncbi:MAG: cytochrome c peroxidase [Gammaproteobacteria bacterium]